MSTETSTSARRRDRGRSRMEEFAQQLAPQQDGQLDAQPDGQQADKQASQQADTTTAQSSVQPDTQPDVQINQHPAAQAARKKKRQSLVDTTKLMYDLRERSAWDFQENKVPMNGALAKELVDGLEEFCHRNLDRNGKPMKRYLVLSKLIEQLLAGEEER